MKVFVKDIIALLTEAGPMTTSEMTGFFPGADPRQVARVVSDMRGRIRKAVYITGYTHTGEPGEKFYPRAIYALGSKVDAPKPGALTPTELTDRWRKKTRAARAKGVPNSVWQWGRA